MPYSLEQFFRESVLRDWAHLISPWGVFAERASGGQSAAAGAGVAAMQRAEERAMRFMIILLWSVFGCLFVAVAVTSMRHAVKDWDRFRDLTLPDIGIAMSAAAMAFLSLGAAFSAATNWF